MWPPEFQVILKDLAERQEYREMWKAILSVCFPYRLGFRTGRLRESDAQARVLAVRDKHPGVLAVATWDTPSPIRHGEIPDVGYAPHAYTKKTGIFHLYSVGSTVSYFRHDPFEQHPENWQGDVWDERGFEVVRHCARSAGGAGMHPGTSDFEDDVEDAIDALKQPKSRRKKPLVNKPPRYRCWGQIWVNAGTSTFSLGTRRGASEYQAASPFTKHFPLDIVMMILSYLDWEDLEVFSRANLLCSALVGPKLFGPSLTFKAHDLPLDEQLDAVLANTPRFGTVDKLTIICDWVWTDALLAKFRQVFELFGSRLKDLSLRILPYNYVGYNIGGEYNPLIRLLVKCSSTAPIKLHRFECEDSIKSSSPLLDFLATQTELRHLVAPSVLECVVDRIHLSPAFLPHLEKIQVNSVFSARLFTSTPTQKIRSVSIHEPFQPPRVGQSSRSRSNRPSGSAILDALCASPGLAKGGIREMELAAKSWFGPTFAKIALCCPELEYLNFGDTLDETCQEEMRVFRNLKRLACDRVWLRSYHSTDDYTIEGWLDRLPKSVVHFHVREGYGYNDSSPKTWVRGLDQDDESDEPKSSKWRLVRA